MARVSFENEKSTFYGLIEDLTAEYERLWFEKSLLRAGLEGESSESNLLRRLIEEQDIALADDDGTEATKLINANGAQEASDTRASIASEMTGGIAVEIADDSASKCFRSFPERAETESIDTKSHQQASETSAFHEAMYPRFHSRRAHFMRSEWFDHREMLSETLNSERFSSHTNYHDCRSVSRVVARMRGKAGTVGSHSYMVALNSPTRIIWGFMSLALLTFDLIMVPIDVCFNMTASVFLTIMSMAARIFWTFDIPLYFISEVIHDGKLFTQPREVAILYLKTWFCFDICLLSMEWSQVIWVQRDHSSTPASMLRVMRWSRMIRLFRVLRFIQLKNIKRYLRGVVSLSSNGLDAVTFVAAVTFCFMLALHCVACVWHLVGDSIEDGWVEASGLRDAAVIRRYAISLHWLFVHVRTDDNGLRFHTTVEYLVDSIVCLANILLVSHFFGAMGLLVYTFATSNVSKMNQFARRFNKRHALHPETAFRMEQCLCVRDIGGPFEVLSEEVALVDALPRTMRLDLLFEIRCGMVSKLLFFHDMLWRTPRVLRDLTVEMGMTVAVANEMVFVRGDMCEKVLFISGGEFWYQCDEEILSQTSRSRPRRQMSRGTDLLYNGDIVSEVVLWTVWEHNGDFMSSDDSIVFYMDARVFIVTITAHPHATAHAVKYARHFCWRMNRDAPCDLMGFDLSLSELDVDLYIGGMGDHFAFISHYKVEAGTEATLLRDELDVLIREDAFNSASDFRSPIFIDSEDLVDLTRLVDHVKGSLTLILLLTPGFLSRPWCLLEIVTARRHSRPYVPVLVARPGISFPFPNEEFYAKLHRDEIVAGGAEGRKLLEENGASLKEVEEAVRSIFMMIALPYSPHKSTAVRRAEVTDILKRCMQLTADSLSDCIERNVKHL